MSDEFDAYRREHEQVHAQYIVSFHDHVALPAHANVEPRIRVLEDYMLQSKTVMTMLRVIFGASIVGAIVSILTLFTLVEHLAT